MTLDRYIFGQTFRPSLLGVVFYTFVLLMNQLFLVVREAFQHGSAVIVIGELLLLALPKILVITIPMALLLGVLVGMGRLSSDAEIVALRSAGVSYVRMARPIVALGILGFAVTAGLYNTAVPFANQRIADLRVQLLKASDPNREIRARVFYDEIPGALLYADEVVRSDPAWPLRLLFLRIEGPEAGQETLVSGRRGRIELAPDGSTASFVLEKGEIHIRNLEHPDEYSRTPFEGAFRQVVPIPAALGAEGPHRRSVQEMTLAELRADLDRASSHAGWQRDAAKSFRYRRALTEIYWRFSLPLACLGFCLLAFPLGLINQRGGKASGFALSLIVVMAYWVALTAGRDLALEGRVSPLIGAWLPDLLIFAAAFGLLAIRQKHEVFSLALILGGWFSKIQVRLSAGIFRRPHKHEPAPDAAEAAVAIRPPPRLPVPLLDRYLSKRFLKTFSYVVVSVFALYSVIEIKGLLDALLETRGAPARLMAEYLLLYAPGMLKVITPVAAVVAALVTLGMICRANEDIAMKAAGISVFRMSAPLLVVTIFLSAGSFAIQDYVAPFTNRKASEVRDRIEGRVSSGVESGKRWAFGKDRRLYGYSDYDPARKVLQDLIAIDLSRATFAPKRVLVAQRVVWKDGRWEASGGWLRSFREGEAPYIVLSNTVLRWPETPDDFARQERSLLGTGRLAEEMNFAELRRHVRRMANSGYDVSRLRAALHEKLAFPAAPLVMVLIGLPFAFRAGRKGSLYGLGIALMLVIAYWSCFAISSALGQEGILPPLLAAWSPNLLFSLTGGYLFLSTRS